MEIGAEWRKPSGEPPFAAKPKNPVKPRNRSAQRRNCRSLGDETELPGIDRVVFPASSVNWPGPFVEALPTLAPPE